MAAATAPAIAQETLFRPVSREMAEDRWLGLSLDQEDPNDPSALAERLITVIKELGGAMGRAPVDGTGMIEDLEEVISEWLVQWAEAGGVSPTEASEVVAFTGTECYPVAVTA